MSQEIKYLLRRANVSRVGREKTYSFRRANILRIGKGQHSLRRDNIYE